MVSPARLASARKITASQFTDRFAVHRPTGETILDPVTLVETPIYATVHADVRGKFTTTEAQTRNAQVPGQKVAATDLAWHTSYEVTGVLTDDEVTCLESRDDPSLAGTRVRVIGPFIKSHATARRFRVEELT